MDVTGLAGLKPTWDIVEFEEGLEDIPCVSMDSYDVNPLEREIVFVFEPFYKVYVYYLPETDCTITSLRIELDRDELTKAFGTRVRGTKRLRGKKVTRPFSYPMVMEDYLVY